MATSPEFNNSHADRIVDLGSNCTTRLPSSNIKIQRTNFFGEEILTPGENLEEDFRVRAEVERMLSVVLGCLGKEHSQCKELAKLIIDIARKERDLFTYEKEAHCVLVREGFLDSNFIKVALAERAKMVVDQIIALVLKGEFLDYGCGDGGVAKELSARIGRVHCVDVFKHDNFTKSDWAQDVSFNLLKDGHHIPFDDKTFDTLFSGTVLHHCDDPRLVVKELRRVAKPGARIIVIESQHGVENKTGGEYAVPSLTNVFTTLEDERQRRILMFFDHFYNRILCYSDEPDKKINCPFNFMTPVQLENLFESEGMKQESIRYLGVDIPIVAEYHVLTTYRV